MLLRARTASAVRAFALWGGLRCGWCVSWRGAWLGRQYVVDFDDRWALPHAVQLLQDLRDPLASQRIIHHDRWAEPIIEINYGLYQIDI